MEAVVGDPEWHGLEELRGVLRAVLARHCQDEAEAEDVIQETYLRAARYRGNLTETGRLRSWTTRIAMNVLADAKRRGARHVPTSPEDVALEIGAGERPSAERDGTFRVGRWELDKESLLLVMAQALRHLGREDRRVLDSFYRGAQSCRETAAECDIPAHLVKIRLFRARKRLLRAIRARLALAPDGSVEHAVGEP